MTTVSKAVRADGLKERIFSGDASESLWDDINKLYHKVKGRKKFKKLGLRCWNAMYFLGCKCQELECEVEQLRRQIEAMQFGLPRRPSRQRAAK